MPQLPRIGVLGIAIVVIAVWAVSVLAGDPPTKDRPSVGGLPHKAVKRQEVGTGVRSYWLFEPAEPTPERAPVVVFLHGWLAVNPGSYGAWIEHLVRRGQIVIFPRYEAGLVTNPSEFLANALTAVRDAFDVLETSPRHVRPDRDRFAVIGHSAGGNLAVMLAVSARENNLPTPRAIISMMPGEVVPNRELSPALIPSTTLLVVVTAEDDRLVGDVRARQIFAEATAVPHERKKYVLYRSDLHGTPRLIADHSAPTAVLRGFDSGDGLMRGLQMNLAEINALDRFGFWRMADITLAAAFAGLTLDQATDRGELFRHLGYWNDGRSVVRPIVGNDLSIIPRVFFSANGLRWSCRATRPPGPANTSLKADADQD